MSRSQAIVLLIFSCAGVAIFMTLDNGLSGADAQDPALGVAYIVVGLGLILYLGAGAGGDRAELLAMGYGLLPLISLVTLWAGAQAAFDTGPEAQASVAVALNVRCAVEKAGLATADAPFVRVRIGMIRDYGSASGRISQTEIEERMGIRILPDCRFERVR